MSTKTFAEKIELILNAESLYKTALKTQIHKKLGLHQITEGIETYLKNQTAGKVIFMPSLTQAGQSPTAGVCVNEISQRSTPKAKL